MKILENIYNKDTDNTIADIEKKKNGFKYYFKRIFLNNKIITSLIIILIIFTVLPCFLTYIISNRIINTIVVKTYTASYLDETYKSIERNINNYLLQVNNFYGAIISDRHLYNIWLDSFLSDEEKEERIRDFFDIYMQNNTLIANLDIISLDNKVVRYKKDLFSSVPDDFQNYISPANTVIYYKSIENTKGENFIVIGKRLFDFKTSFHLGYMYIYLDEQFFSSVFNDVVTEGSSFFITSGDFVISHNNKANVGKLVLTDTLNTNRDFSYNTDGLFINSYDLDVESSHKSKFRIVSVLSYANLLKTYKNLRIEVISVIFFAILVSILMSVIISRILTSSINELKGNMENFVLGDTNDIQFRFSELKSLEKSFDTMVLKINALIKKNNEEKEKQRLAEIRALQAQINPHFIYNTLDAIQWYAKMKNQEYLANIIYALASFFRISLHKGENVIKIREEIDHVKSYVTIEQMRFPKLFDVSYHIDEDVLDYYIPKIVLQPLFENSIKHGFEDMESGGLITLKCYKSGNSDIVFEVKDNGKGFDTSSLDSGSLKSGYGVRNVNERLCLAYGNGYGLKYCSEKGKGTLVTIKIKK